ncbi:4-coumarate--CoA ligase [Sphingomonas ginkgonis]|uniref:4-coumarate--CoA ligase n=1 Tax=Sphingomonas ginkgonis TaxID=2315330 RepID=A0A3R9Z6N6_9SPHN|nr:class I adenylate-forming enzyme family protein [Sphingomonas ginkgonis]RST31127.1 4-coumarate--CoA ligase [Sphingomonas ginkgonis]
MSIAEELAAGDFLAFGDILRRRALEHPAAVALRDADGGTLNWAEFDARLDRIGARLQAEGVGRGATVAILGYNAIGYALAFCAAVRIGAAAAPLTTSAPPEAIAAMLADSGARHLFLDRSAGDRLTGTALPAGVSRIAFDDSGVGEPLSAWIPPEGARPRPVEIRPADAFNIIYSSGTTGTPKGIVQSHAMRVGHFRRIAESRFDADSVTFVSTPLYSNTTLVSFLPALVGGGEVIFMPRFDARRFLELAAAYGVTHAMLVPVQYQRIMALPDFDRFNLSRFISKTCTSAPFSAALKAEVLARWPGGLTEFYGMTEGGGSCILRAHEHPDKLHTVGPPAPGHDIRLIDEEGREVPPGGMGEVVGRSETMMDGYRNQPAKTREAEWFDPEGRRFIRHGDIGRFDEDGFLILMDRAKDLIISGGFNIYPSDLEGELRREPGVLDAAVIGVPSEQWGETPVAYVVLEPGAAPDAILASVNQRLGSTQRIRELLPIDELPRSAIGKVLKRELRDRYLAG